MHFNWIETKNKTTGMGWRKASFQRINLFPTSAEAKELFAMFQGFTEFAGGQYEHFLNYINRVDLQAAHHEYLWFSKTNMTEDGFIIDEEEIYHGDSDMLMRRAEEEKTIFNMDGGDLNSTMDPCKTILLDEAENEHVARIATAFTHVHFATLTDDNVTETLAAFTKVGHGHVLFLDGSALSAPANVEALIAQTDAQIFAINCGEPNRDIIVKGKMITVQ